MAVQIPFNYELQFEYGKVATLSPLIRRVIARNPSPFSFHGTGTYIIGHGEVAVIDPGPLLEDHVDAIMSALDGETITHILVTHTHSDHSPAARLIKQLCPAPTYGYGPHGADRQSGDLTAEGGADLDFVPDVSVKHGEIIKGKDWTMECVFTPGHTSNHMCFALAEEKALFTGDHVMGWSTSIISPPDGDMTAYMDSLHLLLERDDDIYWPTHGDCIRDPKPYVGKFIEHRLERETQILDALATGAKTISQMVPGIYTELDKRMYPAAARSVFAAIIRLVDTGKVRCDEDLTLESEFRLSG